MYMVYWTVVKERDAIPHSRAFASDEMGAAMTFMESLRSRQRAGEGVGFITMSSEHPDSVGHPGVADPSPDYDWKKRRK